MTGIYSNEYVRDVAIRAGQALLDTKPGLPIDSPDSYPPGRDSKDDTTTHTHCRHCGRMLVLHIVTRSRYNKDGSRDTYLSARCPRGYKVKNGHTRFFSSTYHDCVDRGTE